MKQIIPNYEKAIAYKCCWNCEFIDDNTHNYCKKFNLEVDPNFTCNKFRNTVN